MQNRPSIIINSNQQLANFTSKQNFSSDEIIPEQVTILNCDIDNLTALLAYCTKRDIKILELKSCDIRDELLFDAAQSLETLLIDGCNFIIQEKNKIDPILKIKEDSLAEKKELVKNLKKDAQNSLIKFNLEFLEDAELDLLHYKKIIHQYRTQLSNIKNHRPLHADDVIDEHNQDAIHQVFASMGNLKNLKNLSVTHSYVIITTIDASDVLHLSTNVANNTSVALFVENSLNANQNIRKLYLSDNHLLSTAACEISNLTSLTHLDLSNNDIGDVGMQALLSCKEQIFETVLLEDEEIFDDSFQENYALPNLVELDLTNNGITAKGLNIIYKSDLTINVDGNAIDKKQFEKFSSFENPSLFFNTPGDYKDEEYDNIEQKEQEQIANEAVSLPEFKW